MTGNHRSVLALVGVGLLLTGCATATDSRASTRRPADNWSYVGTPIPPFWWTEVVRVPDARAKAGRGAGTTVAVIGTGVLKGHEDLPSVVAGESACGSDTQDYNGHGTQLAGIVAGREPGPAAGPPPPPSTSGVAPDAAIIPIKVDCGVVSADALMKGVTAAVARKPDVVLIAIGGYPSPPPDVFADLDRLITTHREILFVIASTWDGTFYAFPEWSTRDNALLVASMTWDADPNDRARVRKDVEIPYSARRGILWAPGRGVATAGIETDPGSTTHSQFLMHGTSPAAAIVAGCAALVKSKNKNMDGAQLKTRLVGTAEAQPNLGGPAGTDKRLNCAAAIP